MDVSKIMRSPEFNDLVQDAIATATASHTGKVGSVERGAETDSLWQVSVSLRGDEAAAAAFVQALSDELSAASAQSALGQPLTALGGGVSSGRGPAPGIAQVMCTRLPSMACQEAAAALTQEQSESRTAASGALGYGDVWAVDCVPSSGGPARAIRFAIEFLLGTTISRVRIFSGDGGLKEIR